MTDEDHGAPYPCRAFLEAVERGEAVEGVPEAGPVNCGQCGAELRVWAQPSYFGCGCRETRLHCLTCEPKGTPKRITRMVRSCVGNRT